MNEVTDGIKIAIALLLIASVFTTIFCIYAIGSAATYQYYEEQVDFIDATGTTLNDMFNKRLPVPQLVTTIQDSDIYDNIVSVRVSQRVTTSNNITNPRQNVLSFAKEELPEVIRKFSYTTGQITNITTNGVYYLVDVRIGAA